MTPSPLDTSRLARILELLGSPVDGEVLAAARTASRLLRENWLEWRDVLREPEPIQQVGAHQIWPEDDRSAEAVALEPPIGGTWLQTLRRLCAERAGLTPAENRWLDRLCARQAVYPNRPAISYAEANLVVDVYNRWARTGL